MTKALVCIHCLDVRALDPSGEWTSCRCGQTAAHWTDPERGLVAVCPDSEPFARILGMNNGFLLPALRAPTHAEMVAAGGQWEWWRKLHERSIEAPGYVFDKSRRACWAAVVRVNETQDITYAAEPAPDRSRLDETRRARLAVLALRDLHRRVKAWDEARGGPDEPQFLLSLMREAGEAEKTLKDLGGGS